LRKKKRSSLLSKLWKYMQN